MGLFGPPNIEKLKKKKDIKGLIKALRFKDNHIRKKAAESLSEIGDKKARDPLILALNDNDRNVRNEAARALGKIGDKKAVDPLIQRLEEPLFRAIEALGKLGNQGSYSIDFSTLEGRK